VSVFPLQVSVSVRHFLSHANLGVLHLKIAFSLDFCSFAHRNPAPLRAVPQAVELVEPGWVLVLPGEVDKHVAVALGDAVVHLAGMAR